MKANDIGSNPILDTDMNKLWEEYIVQVYSEELGMEIPLCGLCGGFGIVDTTNSAKWKEKPAGIKACCICPNGRNLK